MKAFFDFIVEEKKDPNSDTFHAFDIDDTLFHHDNNKLRIHVKDPNGHRVRTLTTKEYANHKAEPGHTYDFTEFKSADTFKKSAKPIRKMIAKLKAIHKNNKNVELLTARSDLDDKDKFGHYMKQFGIDTNEIHVRRAGNHEEIPGHVSKAMIMHDLINKNGYNKVHLYDDSTKNLDEFLRLKKKHPEVEFHAHHVQHDPETDRVVVTTRKV